MWRSVYLLHSALNASETPNKSKVSIYWYYTWSRKAYFCFIIILPQVSCRKTKYLEGIKRQLVLFLMFHCICPRFSPESAKSSRTGFRVTCSCDCATNGPLRASNVLHVALTGALLALYRSFPQYFFSRRAPK